MPRQKMSSYYVILQGERDGTKMAEQEPLVAEAPGNFPPASSNLSSPWHRSSALIFTLSHPPTATCVFLRPVSPPSLGSLFRFIQPSSESLPPEWVHWGFSSVLEAFSCRDSLAPQGYKSPLYLQRPDSGHPAHSGYSGNKDWLTR